MVQSSRRIELGFIGIGRMGLPMTGRLIAAGHTVHVWDIASDRMVAAAKAGAEAAKHAAEVADKAGDCFFMPDRAGAAVEGGCVWLRMVLRWLIAPRKLSSISHRSIPIARVRLRHD